MGVAHFDRNTIQKAFADTHKEVPGSSNVQIAAILLENWEDAAIAAHNINFRAAVVVKRFNLEIYHEKELHENPAVRKRPLDDDGKNPFLTYSMFRNGIAVYVNGEIRGSWFVQDCEERRRFIPQKETSLMSRKQIAAYNKMPKKDRGLLKKFREKTFTAYQTHWTNWQALVKHFEANNADIRLVTPQ